MPGTLPAIGLAKAGLVPVAGPSLCLGPANILLLSQEPPTQDNAGMLRCMHLGSKVAAHPVWATKESLEKVAEPRLSSAAPALGSWRSMQAAGNLQGTAEVACTLQSAIPLGDRRHFYIFFKSRAWRSACAYLGVGNPLGRQAQRVH